MLDLTGRDLMLAVDVSGSMKAMDMVHDRRPENRLRAVKRVAGEFIRGRSGDRVGLILFGSRAYLQAPLSLDRQTVDQLLQESAIGIAGERTAIGDAIGLALKRLKDRPGSDRLLILLTDGANTTGEMAPRRAAELAALGGLRIHTIGVGSGNSPGLPGLFAGPGDGLDEATLRFIAETTGGRYFRATDAETLAQIYELIDEMEPVVESEERFRPVIELFHWPLGVVMGAGLLWALLTCLPKQTTSRLESLSGRQGLQRNGEVMR
jgi:Ca-activated chloride channel family protein